MPQSVDRKIAEMDGALGAAGYAWKRAKSVYILIWIFASIGSAVIYVIGSVIVEGLGPLVGLAFVFALIVQMPISLAVGGLCELVRWIARGK